MSKFVSGDDVVALKGPARTMNPEHYNVGKRGVVVDVAGKVGNMPYYQVRFNHNTDYIDECNLEFA